ncbi:MAG TPA: outer membrane beta-barrel protein [Anaeromyxobacter sp.]|nr:outer membrane beta-barrel protein [Anaeromyxobacter sp.]
MYVRVASFALAFAAALAPALAGAQPAAARGPNQWSVLVGIEDGPGDSGMQLRADLEFPQRRLSPVVGFAIVGSIGYSRFNESGEYIEPFSQIRESWDNTLNLLKFSGSARFTFGTSSSFRPYADAGLGVYYAGLSVSSTVEIPPYAPVTDEVSDSEVSLFMRLAGGVSFQVSPGFSLGAELGFTPYFGDLDETFTSLLASATFRM